MSRNLAVAIPTYNSSKIVDEMLEHQFCIFKAYRIDVYIYDSSTNNDTYILIKNKWNYENVFYKKFTSNINSNTKVYRIYQDLGDKYDYIWMTRDYHFYSNKALCGILESTKENFDMIVVNSYENSDKKYEIIKDKKEVLFKCISPMTMYGAAIIKTSTMLKNVCWGELENNYLKSDCVNFSHIALYFEQLYKCEDITVKYFYDKTKEMRRSRYKEHSLWADETIRIWSECWCRTVEMICKLYGVDNEFEKKVLKSSPVQFTEVKLLNYRKDNILTESIYLKYKDFLLKVVRVNGDRLAEISQMNSQQAEKELDLLISTTLDNFIQRFPNIVIYGAGQIGKKYGNYMNQHNMKYDCFIVSEKSDNQDKLLNHSIKEYCEIIGRADIGIIVALGVVNTKFVVNKLVNDGFENQILVKDLF